MKKERLIFIISWLSICFVTVMIGLPFFHYVITAHRMPDGDEVGSWFADIGHWWWCITTYGVVLVADHYQEDRPKRVALTMGAGICGIVLSVGVLVFVYLS
ncbi:hypothetical protein [Devriesea agamarum]|uniref:hypothetical protein n=1 Tax=Devriesea agamarum TaxID=472569 RepID=UPI0012EDACF0|nr:hypothetical protein [Devriesea agamarum]